MPINSPGRVEADVTTVNGHTGACLDFDWNPFNEYCLASASEDTTIKIWTIPEEGLTPVTAPTAPVQDLHGHTRKVTHIKFNPTAANALASAAGEHAVKLWDIEKGTCAWTNGDAHEDIIQDLVWDYYGNNLATTSKDKFIRFFDARSGSMTSNIAGAHAGSKSTKVIYLGRSGNLLSVGFTKTSEREFKIWDPRNTSVPLKEVKIDQAAGVMMPFFDNDSNMLYLAGKGDGNIRYYEIMSEAPYVVDCDCYRSTVSARGMAALPKRGLDTSKCETFRMLKLTTNTVEPLSFVVPRKSDSFQPDLYPDTSASVPAHSFDEWIGGSQKAPMVMSMDPSADQKATEGVLSAVAGGAAAKYVAPVTISSLQARIFELEGKLKAAGIDY